MLVYAQSAVNDSSMMLLYHVIILVLVDSILATPNPQVTTTLGKIVGSTLTTRLGKTIYAFRGIRYAKPPINELRFQPPVPVEKWSGIYNATVDGSACPQPTTLPTSEDCLTLNVYTTELPCRSNPRRPVIIFLHGGAFYSLSGTSAWLKPQYFTDQDIVLVTLNYRIGSLGFISTGKDAPGNNGLKDQVVAMRWVKNHIEAFGGDPQSVTLYGYSAGAWSITLHMVSSLSRGLFHKAIVSSGSALGPYPLPKNQLEVAKKQARFVSCPDRSPKEILDCLKTKPAEELGNSLLKFTEFGGGPNFAWSPVIEDDFGQERFLTEQPIKAIERGDFEKIPIIAGITKDEFGHGGYSVARNATLLKELNDNFERYAPIVLLYEQGTDRSREVSRAIREFYLGKKSLTEASSPGLEKVFSDSIVGFGVNRAVNLIAAKSTKPVYYYEFTFQGRYSNFYLPESNGTVPYGVVHHDDLFYLFYSDEVKAETEMVDTMTSLWASFAKTGKPTTKRDVVEWERYNNDTRKYMDIGKKLVLKERLFEERYRFWEKLYPISMYL